MKPDCNFADVGLLGGHIIGQLSDRPEDASLGSETSLKYKKNVAYIGLNSVFGRVVTSLLKQSSAISNLIVYDDKYSAGPLQEYPNNSSDQCKITRIYGKEKLPLALTKADIVVIGEEFYDGQGSSNSKENLAAIGLRAAEYAKMIATFSPNAILVVAASPLNVLLPVYARVLDDAGNFDPNKLLGATSADTQRASPLMAAKLNMKSQTAILPVIGGSSASTRVPLFSQAHPAKAKEIDKDSQTDIITKIKKFDDPDGGEQEVVERAYATVRFIHSIITAVVNNIPVPEIALIRTDQVPDIQYFSLPVLLGKDGVQKIMKLPKLWKFEDKLLNAAIENLQKDVQLSINILEESNRQTEKLESKETSSEIANTSEKSLEERHEKLARYEQGFKYEQSSAKNDLKIHGSKWRKSLTSSQKSEEQSYAWDTKKYLAKTTSEKIESINKKKTLTNHISQNDSSRSRESIAEVKKRPEAILSLKEEEEIYSVQSCQPPDNSIKGDIDYKSLEVNEQGKVNIENKLDTLDQEYKMIDSISLRDPIIIGESLLNTDRQNIIKDKTKLLMEDLERDLALFDDDDRVVIIKTNVSCTKGSQINESNGVLLNNAVNVPVVEHTCANNDGKISDKLTEFHFNDKPKMSDESTGDGENDFLEQKEEKKIQISRENLTTKMATRPKVEKSIPKKEWNEKNTICVKNNFERKAAKCIVGVKNSPLGKNNLNTINVPVAKENKSIASHMKLKEQRLKIPLMPKSQLMQNSKDVMKKKLVNINTKIVENSKNNIVAYPTRYPKGKSSLNNYENKSRAPELTLKPKPLGNLGNASKTQFHNVKNLPVVPKEVKKHNEGNPILESIKLNMKKQANFLKSRTDFSAAELNNRDTFKSSKSGSLADFKESDMIKNAKKQNLIQDPVPLEKKTKIVREKVPAQSISSTIAGVNKSLNSESKSSGNLNSVAPSTSKLLAHSPNTPLQLNSQNVDINQTLSTTENIMKENSESAETGKSTSVSNFEEIYVDKMKENESEKSKEVESSRTSLSSIENVKDSEFDKSKLAVSAKSQKAPIGNETVSTNKQENFVKEQKLVPENINSDINDDRKSLIIKSLTLKTEKEMLDSPVRSTNVVEEKNEEKNNQREKILQRTKTSFDPKRNANNSELSVRAPRNKQHFSKPSLRPGRAVSMGSLNTDWTKEKSISPCKNSYSDTLKSKSVKNDMSSKSNSDLKAHNDSKPQSESNCLQGFQKSGNNNKQSYYSRKAIKAIKLKSKQRRTSLKNEGNQLENGSVSIEKHGKQLEEQNGKSDLASVPKVNDITDDSIERNKGLNKNYKNILKKSKNWSLKSKLPKIVLETKMENEEQTPADGVTKVEKCLKTDNRKVLTCDNIIKSQSSHTIEKQNDKAISTIVNSSKIPQIFHPKLDVASLNPKIEKQSNDKLVEKITNKTVSEAPLKSASKSNQSIALDKNEVNTAHPFTKGNFPGCDSNLEELVILNLTNAANKLETIIKPSTASNPFPAWETISEDYIPYSSITKPIKMPTSLPNTSILLETSNKTEREVVVPGNVPQPKFDGNTKIEKPKTVEANIEKEKLSFEKLSSSYFHQNNVKLNHESSVAVKDLEEITQKIKTQQIFLSDAEISKVKSLPDSASIVDTSNLSTIKPTINNKVKTPIVNSSLQNSQITSSSSKNVIDNTKPVDQTVANSIEPDKSTKLQLGKLYQDNELKEKALPKSPTKSINKVALLNDVIKFKAAKESVKLHKPLNTDSLKKFKAEAFKSTTLKKESTEVKVSDISTNDSKLFKRNRLFFSLNGNKKVNSKKSIKESNDRNFSDTDLLKAEASKRINYSIRAKGSANVENYKLNQTTEPELGNQKTAHNKTIEVITKKNVASNNDSYKGLIQKWNTNLKTPIDTGNHANDVFNIHSTKSHRMQKYVDPSLNEKPKLRVSDANLRARKYMQMASKSRKHGHSAAADENAMPSSVENKNGDNYVKLSIQRMREQLLAGEKMLAFSTTNVTNENKKGQIPDRETIENKKKLLYVAKKTMFSTEKIASLVNTKDMTQQTFANRRSFTKPNDISRGNPLIDEKLKSKHNLDDGLKEQTKTVIKPKSTQTRQYGMLNQLSQGTRTNSQNTRAQKKIPMRNSITNIRKGNNGKEKVFKKPHFISSTTKESSTNPYSYNNRGLYSNTIGSVQDYMAHNLRAQEIDKLTLSSLYSIQPSSSSESYLKANSRKKPTTITRALSEGSNLFVNRNNINDRPPKRTRSTKSYPGYQERLNIPHKSNSTGTITLRSEKSTNAIKSSKSFTVKANKNKSQPYCFKPFVAAVINKMKSGSEEKLSPNLPNGDDTFNNVTNQSWGRLYKIFKQDLENEANGRIKGMLKVQDSKHDLHTDYSYEDDGRISNLKENKKKLRQMSEEELENPIEKPTNVVDYFVHRDLTNV